MSIGLEDREVREHQRTAAQAGVAERWLAKLGIVPAWRKEEIEAQSFDPDAPAYTHSNPFMPFTELGPVPPARGDKREFGGYAHNVDAGKLFSGTTAQVKGIYPFPASSGARVRGVPFGRHLHTAEPIGVDPSQWLVDGLVTNTGIWVQGQPGVGKSTAAKRLLVGLVAYGFAGIIPGDLKDEYSAIVDEMGGEVFRIGRGLHSLNPLDLGPMREAIMSSVGTKRDQLLSISRGRRLALLESLVTIIGGAALTSTYRLLLATAVDIAEESHHRAGLPDPTIPDVVEVIKAGPDALRKIMVAYTDLEYAREIREFVNTLDLLVSGPISGMFDRPSSFEARASSPALSLSLSAVEDDEDDVVAAAMLCAWTWSAGVIEGRQAAGSRRNVFQIQDELWRSLRAAPGLVEKSDRITRLNRHRGVVSLQSTHSITDLEALPTESDRAKAKGMAARNGVKLLGGMDDAEVDRLHAITAFTSKEREMVVRWSAPPTWVPGQRHPGRGKYLIKSGSRMGLPVSVTLDPEEIALYNTDGAFDHIKSGGHHAA
ncbi:hypothetical protein [Rhodococcus qingshengii]|uniref:hypothetical protein n=1 Tax=Rhodococcus qingshengii TaxID=334542 RepID=UPI001F1ED88B|nr:hypothetical protein [Rhodococcus qingshengii]